MIGLPRSPLAAASPSVAGVATACWGEIPRRSGLARRLPASASRMLYNAREREAGSGDALQPPAHDVRGILCGIEEDASWVGHLKAAQAGGPGRHGDGNIERQERLAALGLAADDADGVLRPEVSDEPAQLGRTLSEPPGGWDGQYSDRRRPAAAFAGVGSA